MEIDYRDISPANRDGTPNPEYTAQFERNMATFAARVDALKVRLEDIADALMTADPQSARWALLEAEMVHTCDRIGGEFRERTINVAFYKRAQQRLAGSGAAR